MSQQHWRYYYLGILLSVQYVVYALVCLFVWGIQWFLDIIGLLYPQMIHLPVSDKLFSFGMEEIYWSSLNANVMHQTENKKGR